MSPCIDDSAAVYSFIRGLPLCHAELPALNGAGSLRETLRHAGVVFFYVGGQKRDQLEEGRKLIPAGTSNGGRKMYWLTVSIR